jgi:iron(III) transport system permease protein
VARWRLGVAGLLLVLVVLPVGVPIARLLADPNAWASWREAPRLLELSRNTLILVVGTVALALPLGAAGAILLYRTDLPGRRLFRFLLLLGLFVPLPLFASGWQALLGSGGWLPWSAWNGPRAPDPAFGSGGSSWAPWGQGLASAVLIHAAAGLPWVVLLVGQGLLRVERELEEDALTTAPPVRVLWWVTLPRCWAAVTAAGLWVALQTATEITVTDVMQVRTFAEEVYTQFVADVGLAPAVAVSVPWVALTAVLVLVVARRWERNLPPRATVTGPPLIFRLGRGRWPALLLTAVFCAALLVLPVGSLVRRAGLSGQPATWSPLTVWHHLGVVGRAEAWVLVQSLLVAVLAGLTCAALALVTCWACLDSRSLRTAVFVLIAVTWAMPGPLVGLGLKDTIDGILRVTGAPAPADVGPKKVVDGTSPDTGERPTPEPGSILAVILWHGPSPVPLWWADLIRFFPVAVAMLWPLVRQTPLELRDAARIDGATPGQELTAVVWPLYAGAVLRAALAVGVLTLGELSAGKLIATPGWPGYAQTVFTQMHYGVTADLAGRCLWLLAAVTVGAGLVAITNITKE